MKSPYKGKFKVTQAFKGEKHRGIDLVGLTSKNIYSTVSGIVEAAGRDVNPRDPNDNAYGMGLRIRIKNDATGFLHYFAHLSKILVQPGQRVKEGDLIGVEGSTGHSTGSHLHYEIRTRVENTTYQDVSLLSGIPNKLGTYEQEDAMEKKEITTAEAKAIVKEKAGLDEKTIDYLANDYKYGKDLIIKLAKAMQ